MITMMIVSFDPPGVSTMFDFYLDESYNHHVFYLDASGRIHAMSEYGLARLQAGYPDAELSQMADQRCSLI